MTKIYCSTGGAKKSALEVAEIFVSQSIYNIELSGGTYDEDTTNKIFKLKNQGVDIILHNYFPVPESSFVLNLASLNSEIVEKTMQFYKNSITLSRKIDSHIYAVHSGFLVDPKVNELGKNFTKYGVANRTFATEVFYENISILSTFAQKNDVQLYVENNVISVPNFEKYEKDIFLMTNFEDFRDFNRHFSNEVKILLDIGHLKVSCQALGLDKIRQLILSNNLISGYHLHDNRGLTDDHLIFELEQAWFLNQLKSDVDFITLEIHDFQDLNLASLANQLDRVINHGDLI